jgi:hypothetical protein
MIAICRDHAANVKRWQDGQMVLRWVAAGMGRPAASSAASTATCTCQHSAPRWRPPSPPSHPPRRMPPDHPSGHHPSSTVTGTSSVARAF